ncbi:hypothetical protein L218DRAFT_988486 [Marasmius fiardii PR-910]|nr:hypothetical protein L218DRAFT_988486 [Marasmius fiardii PR-910]
MSSPSSSAMSTPSRDPRRRKPHPQRKTLVRNSSLLGSIKSFVAAPFSRLFAADSSEEFEDEKDFSGKRRRTAPQIRVQNLEVLEDGPAPKRMRVDSPSLSPPPVNRGSIGGYLDPPASAFHQTSPAVYNPPSRSASITIPSTTISDTNSRSTISPLRRQLSSGMTIDSHPSTNTYNRGLSRERSTPSISLVGSAEVNVPKPQTTERPRDYSMPPLSGKPSFIMRSSMTPQPQRDNSEPPPVTSLSSYPVFVRGPSQVNEQRQKSAMPTLGSLVDSQRKHQTSQVASSGHQRKSLLFGRQVQETQPSAVLQELDFYRTPLVPTRLRSKALTKGNGNADITDMFSRKNSLILMGDDNRVRLGGRRGSKKERKEMADNESKPYAGTTGLKKRLAKHKQDEEENLQKSHDHDANKDDTMLSDQAAESEIKSSEIPPPLPPAGKDWFSLAKSSATSSSPKASSLRVGRASRSHLSRPSRPCKTKFSAAYEEDEEVSEEYKKELEEAAKKVPVFPVPAGFTFAKDTKLVDVDATHAKEPPLPSLPFSLTSSTSSMSQSSTKPAEPESAPPVVTAPAAESNRPTTPSHNVPDLTFKTQDRNSVAPSATDSASEGKVPNFFASSKFLSNENTPTPGSQTPTASIQPPSGSSSPFALPPASTFNPPPGSSPGLVSAAVPAKENNTLFWPDAKKDDVSLSQAGGMNEGVPTLFSFTSPNEASPFSAGANNQDITKSSDASPSFSFAKPANENSHPARGLPFSLVTPTTTITGGAQPASSLFPAASSTASTSSFRNIPEKPQPGSLGSGSSFLYGGGATEKSALQAEPAQPVANVGSSVASPFLFGQPQKTETSGSGFSVAEKPKSEDLFGQSSAGQSSAVTSAGTSSSPFSFGTAQNPPKPSFSFGTETKTTEAPTSGGPFTFGSDPPTGPSSNATQTKPFAFGNNTTTKTSDASKPFSFGSSSDTSTISTDTKSFPFANTGSSTGANDTSKSLLFGNGGNTQGTTTGPPKSFAFGAGSGDSSSGASSPFADPKPFPFGFSSSRPVTPPPNPDNEVRMEESPTRDTQKPAEPRPTLSGFSFGTSTSSPFGQSAGSSSGNVSSTIPFGLSGSNSNTFGDMKTDNKPASSSFAFGQTNSTCATSGGSPFSFGFNKPDNEPPRPSTTGSFSFGSSPSSSTAPFAFGSSSNTTSNLFGAQQSGSAPSSPSFNPPTTSFGSSSNPFAFGSQPTSPATPSSSLPQPSGFVASSGGFGSSQPAVGALFTMGSASPANNQGRRIKGLPKRGGKR